MYCRTTSYIDQMSAWYDAKTKQEIVSIKMFEKLEVWLCHHTVDSIVINTEQL